MFLKNSYNLQERMSDEKDDEKETKKEIDEKETKSNQTIKKKKGGSKVIWRQRTWDAKMIFVFSVGSGELLLH